VVLRLPSPLSKSITFQIDIKGQQRISLTSTLKGSGHAGIDLVFALDDVS